MELAVSCGIDADLDAAAALSIAEAIPPAKSGVYVASAETDAEGPDDADACGWVSDTGCAFDGTDCVSTGTADSLDS